MTLTEKQREVLEKIHATPAEGFSVRYEWIFKVDGEIATRQVNALRKKGYVDMLAFNGGHSAINITDKGRAALAA